MNGNVINTSTRPDCTAANMTNSIGMKDQLHGKDQPRRSKELLITPAKKPPSSIGAKNSAPTIWLRLGESAICVSRQPAS